MKFLTLRGWLLALTAVVGGVTVYHFAGGAGAYTLVVPVSSAAGLYPGSDVLIAGAHAGHVNEIALRGTTALVTIEVDSVDAPVRSDATATVRPKSLLGERYVALDPGTSGSDLPSGSELPLQQVAVAVDLQDVLNAVDAPTRARLQTLIDQLGTGLTGRGPQLNQTIQTGRTDIDNLTSVTDTLAQRDQDIAQAVTALDQVTAELSQTQRSQDLGALVQNAETSLHSLAQQDQQLESTLTAANSSLSKANAALNGTAPELAVIFQQLPLLVRESDAVTADLTTNLSALSPLIPQFVNGIREGPVVFGGHDAGGYATRVQVVFAGSAFTSSGSAARPASYEMPSQVNSYALYQYLLSGAGQ